jgi:hypothetical protein
VWTRDAPGVPALHAHRRDGRPLIARLAATNLLPSPESAKIVQLKYPRAGE